MAPDTPPALSPTDRPRRAVAVGLLVVALAAGHARAEEAGGTEALAKQAQNPIADLISVPFQDNVDFGVGERGRTQNVLNFQPVIPFKIGGGWNLITRTIAPVVHQPSLYKGVPGVRTSDDPEVAPNRMPFTSTVTAPPAQVNLASVPLLRGDAPSASARARRRP